MVAPLKISARVDIDASQAKQGAAAAASAVDTIGAAAERNTTRVQALINASVGLGGGAANQNIREWTGALAMQGKSLDELRAKYNPIFATISQYKAAQMEIRTLHAQGVLSTNEMTAAIQRQRQATLASIDAIKGRNSLMRGGRDAEAGFRRQNLGYQVFDIGQGLGSGMPLGMIAAQQLPQVAQLYAGQGGGIKAMLSDIGSLATGAVSAIGAMPLAIGAAGAAAILYDRNVNSAAAKAEVALQKHEEALVRIKALFDQSGSGAERYGQRVQGAISFAERSDRRNLEDALAAQTQAAGRELLNAVPRGSGAAMTNLYGPYLAAVQKFVAEARQGRGDIAAFNDEVNRIANAHQTDERVQRIGQRLLETTKAASDTASKIRELNNEFARTSMLTARTDAALTMTQYRIENADALTAIRRMSEAELGGIGARSPNELAEAARARVRAEPVNPRESVEVRAARETAAATLARAQAERSLLDAIEQRNRQLDNSIASQQLELSLIGQTIGEQERLRMQFRLTAELQAEADRTGTTVSAAELERVKALSAEYGRLAEQMVARRAIEDGDRELAELRTRLSLVGQTEEARARVIVNLETERRLREMGIDLNSREAEQIRENARLRAAETEELRKQEAAWGKVRDTAENSIDTIFDKFSEGDFEGALKDLGKDWSKTILQLGGSNPLKNGLLGTNHETLGDIGGLGGMFSKLFGGGMSTGAMSVTAATVNVNGGIAGSVPSLLNPTANDNSQVGNILKAAGTTKTGIPLSEVVAGSGLTAKVSSEYAPRFQGLLNDLKAAGYNVSSLGEGGYSYRNVAGTGNLSKHAFGEAIDINPRANPWSHTFKTDLPSNINELAQKNGLTWGGTWNKPDTMHFQVNKSIDNAALALNGVAKGATATTESLGALGADFGEFGKGLTSFFPSAPTGGGGLSGWFSKLFGAGGGLSSIGQSLLSSSSQFASAWSSGGLGLFAKGGISDRPAIFGEAGTEAAVPLPDGRTIPVTLNVRQAHRPQGVANGNAVPGRNAPIINNYGNGAVGYEETTDQYGNRQPIITIGEQGAAAVSQRGNPMRSAMQSEFGLRPRRVSR